MQSLSCVLIRAFLVDNFAVQGRVHNLHQVSPEATIVCIRIAVP
jgi:hypothetical protein